MEPEELQKKIDTLQRQVDTMSTPSGFQLKYPLDPESQKIIVDVVTENAVDILWKDYVYMSPFFADTARFDIASGGSLNFGSTFEGLVATTAASNGSFDGGTLYVDPSVIKLTRDTRFRATVEVNSTSNIDARVTTLLQSTNEMGFNFVNGTLYGYSTNSGGTATVNLGSYAANTAYILELRFYPGGAIRYFVDDVERDSIASVLPIPTTTGSISIFGIAVTTSAAAVKQITASYAEFIQRRK